MELWETSSSLFELAELEWWYKAFNAQFPKIERLILGKKYIPKPPPPFDTSCTFSLHAPLKCGLIPGIYHLTNWSDFIWGVVTSSRHVCMRASSRHHTLIGRQQKRGMYKEDRERERSQGSWKAIERNGIVWLEEEKIHVVWYFGRFLKGFSWGKESK